MCAESAALLSFATQPSAARPTPDRPSQVGVCGVVHGVELHESNVAFARKAVNMCVALLFISIIVTLVFGIKYLPILLS